MAFQQSGTRKTVVSIFQTALLLGVVTWFGVAAGGGSADELYQAADSHDMATAKQLIANGIDVNLESSDGSYALNAAAVNNDHDMLRLFLSHGAYVNVQNSQGDTPLICATKYAGGDELTVKLLVEAGTNVKLADNKGKTALDYAIGKDQKAAIALLKNAE